MPDDKTSTPDLHPIGFSNPPLRGRRALVTGGGRGLGTVISAHLARAGARVAITGRDKGSLRE